MASRQKPRQLGWSKQKVSWDLRSLRGAYWWWVQQWLSSDLFLSSATALWWLIWNWSNSFHSLFHNFLSLSLFLTLDIGKNAQMFKNYQTKPHVAKKRKIYDDAKSGRYDAAKSSSYSRSHYQPRDYSSRDYGSRDYSSRDYTSRDYSARDYTPRHASSRYSDRDYTSSKSPRTASFFRGFFEKTFCRFFGGRLQKQFSCFFRVICVFQGWFYTFFYDEIFKIIIFWEFHRLKNMRNQLLSVFLTNLMLNKDSTEFCHFFVVFPHSSNANSCWPRWLWLISALKAIKSGST